MYVVVPFVQIWRRSFFVQRVTSLTRIGWVYLALTVFALGCTKGEPEFKDIGSRITAPDQFDKTSGLYIITSLTETLTLTARCDVRTKAIELRPDGGAWKAVDQVTTLASEYNCKDGTFTLILPDAGQFLGFTDGVAAEKKLYLRGLSEIGFSSESYVTVRYITVVPKINLSAASSATEGSDLAFTVTLDVAPEFPVEVDYSCQPQTATAADYTCAPGRLTFAVGETAKNVVIPTFGDAVFELNETLSLVLANESGGELGTANQETGTIINDDPVPVVQFAAASASITEDAMTQPLFVTVSGATYQEITVNFTQAGSTATLGMGGDYQASATTSLVLPPETTGSQAVTLTIAEDPVFEGDEIARWQIASVVGANSGTQLNHELTIVDDESVPTLQFTQASRSITEDATTIAVSIAISHPSQYPTSVDVTPVAGTAQVGSDFQAMSLTLPIPALTSGSVNYSFTVLEDSLFEGTETATLNLGTFMGLAPGSQTSQTISILDDEVQPQVQFDLAASSVVEDNASHSVAVTLTAPAQQAVTVDYVVSGGSATSGVDYVVSAGTLTFPAGTTSNQFINVAVLEDAIFEGTETLTLRLQNPAVAALGSRIEHTLTLSDDETQPVVYFSTATSSGPENPGTVALDVTLSSAAAENVTVTYAVQAVSTATAGADFNLASSSVVFPAGSSSPQMISLTILDDGLF